MKKRLDIRNGYLYSGVIGNLDEDGFLKITDRKKEIFKQSGGKNTAPAVIDSKINYLGANRSIQRILF